MVTVIVRILHLEIKTDMMQQFLKEGVPRLHQIADGTDGLLDMEVLWPLDNKGDVVVITRWRDEEAIKAFAGPMWRQRPVRTDADLAHYLAHTSHVSHHFPVDAEGSPIS